MKSLIVYSSRTGNTRKVAEAIFELWPEPKEIHPVETAPPPDGFDFIAMGFWVNEGNADQKARIYMQSLSGKKIALFGTLGAYPDSDHARNTLEKIKTELAGNDILGGFMCQGRVDPDVADKIKKIAPEPVSGEPRKRNRIIEAEYHPDEKDLANARIAFSAVLQKLREDMDHA